MPDVLLEQNQLFASQCPLVMTDSDELLVEVRNLLNEIVNSLVSEGICLREKLIGRDKHQGAVQGEVMGQAASQCMFDAIDCALTRDRLCVGLVGQAAAGKSTLGNLLAGMDVFPSGMSKQGRSITAMRTRIQRSAGDGIVLEIKRRTRTEVEQFCNRVIEEVLKHCRFPRESPLMKEVAVGSAQIDMARVDASYQELREEDDSKDNYLTLVRQLKAAVAVGATPTQYAGLDFDVPKNLQRDRSIHEQIKEFVTTPESSLPPEYFWVRELVLTIPESPSESDSASFQLDIIDLPGYGSRNLDHDALTASTIPELDGLILLLKNAERAGDEQGMIDIVESFRDGVDRDISGRVFAIVTRLDSNDRPDLALEGTLKVARETYGLKSEFVAIYFGRLFCLQVGRFMPGDMTADNRLVEHYTEALKATDFGLGNTRKVWERFNEENPSEYSEQIESWTTDGGFSYLKKLVFFSFKNAMRDRILTRVRGLIHSSIQKVGLEIDGALKCKDKEFKNQCDGTRHMLQEIEEFAAPESSEARKIWKAHCVSTLESVGREINDEKLSYNSLRSELEAAESRETIERKEKQLNALHKNLGEMIKEYIQSNVKLALGSFQDRLRDKITGSQKEAAKIGDEDYFELAMGLFESVSNNVRHQVLSSFDYTFEITQLGEGVPAWAAYRRLMVRKCYFTYRRLMNVSTNFVLEGMKLRREELLDLVSEDKPMLDEHQKLTANRLKEQLNDAKEMLSRWSA